MKTMKLFTGQVFIITFLMLMILPGYAQQGRGNGNCTNFITGLTDDQKEKIDKIHLNLSKQILPIQNQLDEKKAHLKTLNSAEKPDMAKINATIDEIGGLKTDIMKKRVAARQDIRAQLTEEQRIEFDSRGPGMHKGKGRGQGYGHRHGQGKGMGPGCCQGGSSNCKAMTPSK